MNNESNKRIQSFKEFYPFYLTQHSKLITRFFHFIGTLAVVVITIVIIIKPEWWMLFLIPVSGYGFAWIGHFVFEKNNHD